MSTRRLLIGLPIIVLLFLLQSYFWVPTYEEQTRGNPERLEEYVTASIGDAQVLNPALSADSASSDINGLVFEGLLDYDENLNFRPRLATSWEIHEEAYFYVNDRAEVPNFGRPNADGLATLIIQAKGRNAEGTDSLSRSLSNIEAIEVLPAQQLLEEVIETLPEGNKVKVRLQISAPPRIKLRLKRVDQDLFDNLEKLLGTSYFTSFQAERFITVEPAEFGSKKKEYARVLLPAVEHNPVIIFKLRPGVKFHDGHIFDGYDVKFTYDAIMDPAN
ncbi:MAG: peptide ABC transporter substrate-binding protein, partial [Deltaproteobacteria bacterium]|nr:peptide ABC transporter substrate-binding protein [Deltaproteobacteria bacterium]